MVIYKVSNWNLRKMKDTGKNDKYFWRRGIFFVKKKNNNREIASYPLDSGHILHYVCIHGGGERERCLILEVCLFWIKVKTVGNLEFQYLVLFGGLVRSQISQFSELPLDCEEKKTTVRLCLTLLKANKFYIICAFMVVER